MKPLIIACSVIRDELELSLETQGLASVYDIVWLDGSLHNAPGKLRKAVQEQIDAAQGRPIILLAYANCGNGLAGIRAVDAPIVIPRAADCISLFLHERDDLEDLRRGTYFLTRGWLESEQNLDAEYQHMLEEYGAELTQELVEMMYGHYRTLMLIDTGAYSLEDERGRHERIASQLGMEPCTVKGGIALLDKLLLQQWDEDSFICKKPGETLSEEDFVC